MAASFAAVFSLTPAFLQRTGGKGDFIRKRREPELTDGKPELLVGLARQRVSARRTEGEESSVPERRDSELTGIKPELRVCPAKQGDFVPEEEEDSKEVTRRFLDSGVGL